jgi:hypothetical protein
MNPKVKELMGKTLDSKFSHTWTALDYQDLEVFSDKLVELVVKDCYVALFPALRDMISRGQAYDMIKEHFNLVDNDWLIRKVPNTKDEFYVESGNPPQNVLDVYGIKRTD